GPQTHWTTYAGVPVIMPRAYLANGGSTASTPGTLTSVAPLGGENITNPTNPTPVPSGYLALRPGDRSWAFGVAVTSPFGLSEQFDSTWWGRYDSLKVSLKTYNFAPTGAYEAIKDHLSVGGGLDIQHATSELSSAIPNPLTPGGPTAATDGTLTVTGTSNKVG